MSDRTILITGVTGHQGGAVAQALQGAGFPLRGLTRTPDSERAEARALNSLKARVCKKWEVRPRAPVGIPVA
jgi:nucleoside-diphosphate-sugar epimerase